MTQTLSFNFVYLVTDLFENLLMLNKAIVHINYYLIVRLVIVLIELVTHTQSLGAILYRIVRFT